MHPAICTPTSILLTTRKSPRISFEIFGNSLIPRSIMQRYTAMKTRKNNYPMLPPPPHAPPQMQQHMQPHMPHPQMQQQPQMQPPQVQKQQQMQQQLQIQPNAEPP